MGRTRVCITLVTMRRYGTSESILRSELRVFSKINHIPHYLQPARNRLAGYMPDGFNLNVNDTYGIQEICAYEVAAFGTSDFCGLFTLAEWEGFEYLN